MHAGLSNAVSATLLAVLVACLGRVLARRPAILHCLWLLVLLKLVTPPLYQVPIPWPESLSSDEKNCAVIGPAQVAAGLELLQIDPENLDERARSIELDTRAVALTLEEAPSPETDPALSGSRCDRERLGMAFAPLGAPGRLALARGHSGDGLDIDPPHPPV